MMGVVGTVVQVPVGGVGEVGVLQTPEEKEEQDGDLLAAPMHGSSVHRHRHGDMHRGMHRLPSRQISSVLAASNPGITQEAVRRK